MSLSSSYCIYRFSDEDAEFYSHFYGLERDHLPLYLFVLAKDNQDFFGLISYTKNFPPSLASQPLQLNNNDKVFTCIYSPGKFSMKRFPGSDDFRNFAHAELWADFCSKLYPCIYLPQIKGNGTRTLGIIEYEIPYADKNKSKKRPVFRISNCIAGYHLCLACTQQENAKSYCAKEYIKWHHSYLPAPNSRIRYDTFFAVPAAALHSNNVVGQVQWNEEHYAHFWEMFQQYYSASVST